MANQRDVARAAGVSSATVSRFLTNPASVSSRAAGQIREAIKTLGYQLDSAAQALRTGRSRLIGVFTPGGGPFHWAVYTAAQEVFLKAGYSGILYSAQGDLTETSEFLAPVMRSRQIDGVLHLPTLLPSDDRAIEELTAWGRPFVVLDRPLPHATVPQVFIDNYKAGRRAAREFLDHGHRQFLFIWGRQEYSSAQNRFLGFRDELKREGIALPLDRQLEGEYFSLSTFEETVRRWDRLPPFTAVFASNDSSALGFLKAARQHGKQAPEDFSLIGFDDNFEFTLLYDPPLATFSQPGNELGAEGARMLLRLLDGEPLDSSRVALDAQFVDRASLRPVPVPAGTSSES